MKSTPKVVSRRFGRENSPPVFARKYPVLSINAQSV